MSKTTVEIILQTTVNGIPDNNSGTVIVTGPDGVIASKSVGPADLAKGLKNSENTQYLIGSVTKQFTAAALLKSLHLKAMKNRVPENEQEEYVNAELHRPITNFISKDHPLWAGHIPEWANQVNLHHLLSHSSGIPNFTNHVEFRALRDNSEAPTTAKLVSLFGSELEFNPGTKAQYSNSGYLLLGEIIKEITEQKLDSFMDEVIFKPAGMTASFLATKGKVPDLQKDPRAPKLAHAYGYDITAKNPQPLPVKYEYMQTPGGAGAMVSSAPDLLVWNAALYTNKIMPKFLTDLMLQPHMPGNRENYSYGYGIMVEQSPTLGTYYTHGGSIPGFLTKLTYIPSQQISIVSLSNAAENWIVSNELKSAADSKRKKLDSIEPALDDNEKNKRFNEAMQKQFPNIVTNKLRFVIADIERKIVGKLELSPETNKTQGHGLLPA